MASPKGGSAGSAVAPADVTQADEAVESVMPEVSEVSSEAAERTAGVFGKQEVEPHSPPSTPEEQAVRTSWIEIVLVDDDDNPVAGEPYAVETPEGTVAQGTLDHKGFARVEGIEPGTCKVTFPKLDKSIWKKA